LRDAVVGCPVWIRFLRAVLTSSIERQDLAQFITGVDDAVFLGIVIRIGVLWAIRTFAVDCQYLCFVRTLIKNAGFSLLIRISVLVTSPTDPTFAILLRLFIALHIFTYLSSDIRQLITVTLLTKPIGFQYAPWVICATPTEFLCALRALVIWILCLGFVVWVVVFLAELTFTVEFEVGFPIACVGEAEEVGDVWMGVGITCGAAARGEQDLGGNRARILEAV
jgi:hypothetical protein